MRYYKQYPVMLEHYLDHPVWAVIAGYDYTFGDVICSQLNRVLRAIKYVFSRDGLDDFLDYEIRQLPEFIAKIIGFLLLITLYPICFWLFAIIQMGYHRKTREKYRNGLPDDVNNHIIYWLRRFKK
ncbi:hypothetical protein [Xenorhabdus anantnagensis]|uniref:Uncharacterized protein n=1 Tax=Xenorhabdus anantnagensis TaxID=3025875 RepID=A0ABT5LWP6_9GAMM|nr:hypothetical protein [Xenorhabdus anantnagensis]MDC9598875.1 hypothetical protein [Xenorhabdus anantnagensis]